MRYILVLLFFSSKIVAQDSLVVNQVNASMFSNRYVFFPDGTFKHYFQTDDAQAWYGIGNYEDKGNKRILSFKDPNLNFKKKPFLFILKPTLSES